MKQVSMASRVSISKPYMTDVKAGSASKMTPFTDTQIRETFEIFDLNSNGYVGAAEIRYILDLMGEEVSD